MLDYYNTSSENYQKIMILITICNRIGTAMRSQSDAAQLPLTPMQNPPYSASLHLDKLRAGYPQHPVTGEISLSIPTEKMTILCGANGSGKSTLLNTLSRMLSPLSGQVILDGKAIHQQPTRQVARQLGILPQSPLLPEGLTVLELISRGRYPWQGFLRQWSDADERAVAEAMRLTGTEQLAHLAVETLSGGQRQRCWIAMTLAQQTPLILLDEPTTFLDVRYQVEILELLRDLTRYHQRTVIMVLHDVNFAMNYADRLVFIKQGELAAVLDDTADCTPQLMHSVFGLDVKMMVNPHTGKPFFLPFPTKETQSVCPR